MESKKSQNANLKPVMVEAIARRVLQCQREDEKRARQKKQGKCLRNTKLLLEHYRDFMTHSENAVFAATQIDRKQNEDMQDLLEWMERERSDSYLVESIRSSAVRTRVIMEHVQNMLDVYRSYCERSPCSEDRRRLSIIHALYLNREEVKTVEQVAEENNMDIRTVYRDVQAAVEKLTFLIFGVDGIRS